MIQEYNKLFDKIVIEFGTRFYKEAFDEKFDFSDIYIIEYEWYKHILEISDEFYDLENMLFTLEYNIPIKVLREWYSLYLETEWKPWINLINYFKQKKNPKEYEKQEKESLKKAKENCNKAYKEFMWCIKN